MKKFLLVSLGFILIIVTPFIGSWFFFHGKFPDHFFLFPPLTAPPKPGFSLGVFLVILIFIIFFIVLYLYPWLFGFKKPDPNNIPGLGRRKRLPFWFWIGLVVSVIDGVILFVPFDKVRFVINMGFAPIIWGLLFVIDGIVYSRANGKSILGTRPIYLLLMTICSALAWGYFEYLSFFVDLNWIYPEGDRINTLQFYLYAIIGGGVLVPLVFEGYMLLCTFKPLRRRYSYGPKITIKRPVQIIIAIICLVAMYVISYHPFVLFPLLWLGPVIILSIIFDMAGLWTPFKPVATHGNWTPLALIALAELVLGFIYECVNYLSASHHPFHTLVPGYWKYSIPYVDKFYIFEMPLEGIFGYLPYGIYNWVVWIGFAYIFKATTQFDSGDKFFEEH